MSAAGQRRAARRTKRRDVTRAVYVGGVPIGGGHPIPVQSMTNTKTADVEATARQIQELEDVGCDIVRVAVPDMESARAIEAIKKRVRAPIVADIHFDYRLALESMARGADKIRINPGNIGGAEQVRQVAAMAKARGVPIRVGVNGGSLERSLAEKYGGATPEALAESALAQAEALEGLGFSDIVLSIKSSDAFTAVEACRIVSKLRTGYPQHIGMTEAGTPLVGVARNAVGISALLREGIGDTVRVSLTGDPVDEVVAAIDILRTHGLRRGGVRLVSCPACGRCGISVVGLAEEVERRVRSIRSDKEITVAVMGCAVNGPGEARGADVGVAGGRGRALLFRRGEAVRMVPEAEVVDALVAEVERIAGQT